jgi:hypothetical protein
MAHDATPQRQPDDGPGVNPADRDADPFHPPSISTLVECLHCGQQYESYLIEWRVQRGPEAGRDQGFWCCPTPGCDGRGFGFDIHPIDHHWVDPDGRDMGWVDDPPPDPETDFDKPPQHPTPVRCERCGRTYSSADMVWWVDEDAEPDAFIDSGWRCPTEDCTGMGFGRDVRPTDPKYIDPDGRRLLRPGEKPQAPPACHDEDVPF